jgi:hypothetical protein
MLHPNQTLRFAMVLSLALFSASCIKDTLKPQKSVPVTASTDGGIVDLGEITAGVHHYSISLSNVTLSNGGKSASALTSAASIELYTNTDGIINDGTYAFSASGEAAPFTFRSGTFYATPQSPGSFNAFMINDGSVTVKRDGISYAITINGTDSTGNSFTGNFSGTLSYQDAEIAY